jgi:hypothetical protein
VNELVSGDESFASIPVGSAVVSAVVDSRAVYNAVLAVSLAGGVMAVLSLGDGIVDVAVVVVGADVLDVVNMAFTAAIFAFKLYAFKLDVFSRHFFFWERFACPGPGILRGRTTQKKTERLVDWSWVL